MRFGIQILSAALLAGVATAQTAPASQTVQQKSATSAVQNGTNAAKGPAKSPFAPKAKPSKPAAVPTSKSPVASKSQPPAATKKASIKAQPVATTKKASVKAQPVATQQAKATPKAAKKVPAKTAVKKPAPAPAKTATKIPAPAPAPVVTAPAKPAQPAVAQSAPAKLPNPGKRDPFLSPLAAAAARAPVASCSTGKHCLEVNQIALKGIVQTKEGNIAMVENGARHSYYLHENDSLFDGSVEKISNDSVTFRQEGNDVLGRPVSKEVVKKVSAPAV